MLDKNIFSERVKALRLNRGISQSTLGQSLNMRKTSISMMERATNAASSDTLVALADYFDVSIDYLVGRTDNPDSHKL